MRLPADGCAGLRRSLVVGWLGGLVVAAGCRGQADPRPARVPFKARVVLGDAPVAEAVVVLSPQDDGHAATGRSDAAGDVVFSTFGSRDGVVPGRYTVMVSKTEASSGDAVSSDDPAYDPAKAAAAYRPARGLLPARYKSAATSGLTVEVPVTVGDPEVFRLVP
jgi:hypothetical protein